MRALALTSVALTLNLCLQDACRATSASGTGPCAASEEALEDSRTTVLAAVPPVGTAAWAAAAWYQAQAAARSSAEGSTESSVPARLRVNTEGEDDLEIPEAGQGDDGRGGRAPVYRTWWFWASVGGGLIVAAVLATLGGGSDEDLPDFPDPPEE